MPTGMPSSVIWCFIRTFSVWYIPYDAVLKVRLQNHCYAESSYESIQFVEPRKTLWAFGF